jgi:DNA repair photolyase
MRWDSQKTAQAPELGLFTMPGLVRTVRTPEFAGLTFHEVNAKSVLNRVHGDSKMPFHWTINPYRGCSHACTYCFARNSHTYLDFDAGRDFDEQIVIKVNAVEVLRAELARSSWGKHPVSLGTNTDPYQRAEGRYQLMPGIIRALAEAGSNISILTKGTLITRDVELLTWAQEKVSVNVGISLALEEHRLQQSLEPGAPSIRARLAVVRKLRDAGLPCYIFIAPILPGLTDSAEQLDDIFRLAAEMGVTTIYADPLNLGPGTKEWFLQWLAEHEPKLLERYHWLYRGGRFVDRAYADALNSTIERLRAKHGLQVSPSFLSTTREPEPSEPEPEQLSLL